MTEQQTPEVNPEVNPEVAPEVQQPRQISLDVEDIHRSLQIVALVMDSMPITGNLANEWAAAGRVLGRIKAFVDEQAKKAQESQPQTEQAEVASN